MSKKNIEKTVEKLKEKYRNLDSYPGRILSCVLETSDEKLEDIIAEQESVIEEMDDRIDVAKKMTAEEVREWIRKRRDVTPESPYGSIYDNLGCDLRHWRKKIKPSRPEKEKNISRAGMGDPEDIRKNGTENLFDWE